MLLLERDPISMTKAARTFSIDTRPCDDGSFVLNTSQTVPATVEQLFPFFENARNLSEITPPWLDFRLINPDTAETSRRGARYEYTIRWFWIRVGWQSEIVEYVPPHRFVDVQLKGPYALWRHVHLFEAVEGGTLLRDTVSYRLPFGTLGRMVHRVVVKRQLRGIFLYRAVKVQEWVGRAFGQACGESATCP